MQLPVNPIASKTSARCTESQVSHKPDEVDTAVSVVGMIQMVTGDWWGSTLDSKSWFLTSTRRVCIIYVAQQNTHVCSNEDTLRSSTLMNHTPTTKLLISSAQNPETDLSELTSFEKSRLSSSMCIRWFRMVKLNALRRLPQSHANMSTQMGKHRKT